MVRIEIIGPVGNLTGQSVNFVGFLECISLVLLLNMALK